MPKAHDWSEISFAVSSFVERVNCLFECNNPEKMDVATWCLTSFIKLITLFNFNFHNWSEISFAVSSFVERVNCLFECNNPEKMGDNEDDEEEDGTCQST